MDPRQWAMVVFWKENSGHQPQLITPENEGGDETSYPSPPSNIHFFDDPDDKVHHLLNLQHLLDLLDHRQDGLKLLRHLVTE